RAAHQTQHPGLGDPDRRRARPPGLHFSPDPCGGRRGLSAAKLPAPEAIRYRFAMRPPTASTASAGAPLARAGRYVLRVPMLLWHALVHLPLVMIGLALPTDRIGLGGESLRDRLARAWQGGLLRVFGLRMRRVGTPLPGGTLFVANHVSWMDISALHSQRMMGF